MNVEAIIFIVLFALSMGGAVLRKNVLMALLSLFMGNVSALILIVSFSDLWQVDLKVIVFNLFLMSFLVTVLGFMVIAKLYKLHATIMSEEIKNWNK